MKGFVLIFYPHLAKKLHGTTVQMVHDVSEAAADGAGSEEVHSETDVDEDLHDYTNDGSLLPDTMTAIHTVKSNGERTAQLAADQADILFELGLADLEARYPRHITFVHTKDSYSEKDVTRALFWCRLERNQASTWSQ